ncbi:MAG: DNA-formamidopyrimidine glycosylase [Anaerolineaceae bacterium]|nr:MAG: DNA-formamidopyrimidine glycosylase [Anaerolineaceae bacterium]
MPELPEVETIAQTLRRGNDSPPLPGQRIKRVTIRWPRHIAMPSVTTFRRRIRDRLFSEVNRRGKYLVFALDRGTMLIHLRMSGDLVLVPPDTPAGRYDRTVFYLEDDHELRFSDARKFGKIFLLDDPDIVLGKLGPEPLDASFTPLILASRLLKRRRILKPLLMDQTFIAGLGNIYTDEALYHARLHPLRRSDSLDMNEITALWQGIRDALTLGLRHSGASIDWVYRGGDFQHHFRVYGRSGEPCLKCGTSIERIIVGQRGTHFCPTCQGEVNV